MKLVKFIDEIKISTNKRILGYAASTVTSKYLNCRKTVVHEERE
jgi:hypothetical protein